jgi:hypothetical protein
LQGLNRGKTPAERRLNPFATEVLCGSPPQIHAAVAVAKLFSCAVAFRRTRALPLIMGNARIVLQEEIP